MFQFTRNQSRKFQKKSKAKHITLDYGRLNKSEGFRVSIRSIIVLNIVYKERHRKSHSLLHCFVKEEDEREGSSIVLEPI
jgi:hypothetical protein